MIPISYNVRSMMVRKTTTFATAFGIALVVLVLSSGMMLVSGIKRTLVGSGSPDNAIVLKAGAPYEMMSMIEDPQVQKLLVQPQVKRDGATPMASGEIVQVVQIEKVGAGYSNILIRGLTEQGVAFRPQLKMLQGTKPKVGAEEVMVGKRVYGKFKGLTIGESIELRKNHNVKVVGVFEDAGSSYESEIWGDLDIIRKGFRSDGIVSSVRIRLASRDQLEALKATIEHDKSLGFDVSRETDFYEAQSEGLALMMSVLGTAISVFFSIVAMIGAMITMYSAVSTRQREIGTLRALGFPRSNILISFLAESMILTFVGGTIGALASLAMGFVSFSMLGASWSEVVFTFQPTPEIIGKAVIAAGLMGLFGGLLPSIRAARISTLDALRGN